MMSRRTEVTEALLRILQDEAPEVSWNMAVTGAKRGKEVEGTVTCDRIRFEDEGKGEREATAEYSIYILDARSLESVDALADKVESILTANATLDNWATDSRVKMLVFGAPQGRPNVGLALIDFEVKFDV